MPYLYGPNHSFPVKVEEVRHHQKVCSNAIEFKMIDALLEEEIIRWVYENEEDRNLDFERIKKELGELKNDN